MAGNPHVNKVVANGSVLMDLTSDTVVPSKLASGYTAHSADGSQITGTMEEPVAMTSAEVTAAVNLGWNGG